MKLQPAIVFGSRMVLQRQKPIVVWGKGAEADVITVTLGKDSVSATVEKGQWRVSLPAREAETGLQMTIQSADLGDTIVYSDISVGEVWVAGGQSNMEFLFKYDIEAAELTPAANDPQLRFFDMPEVSYPGHLEIGRFEDYGFWRTWNPKDAPWFSAVAMYFAAQIRRTLDVPVGILACNWGGSCAATWTARDLFMDNPALKPVQEEVAHMFDDLDRNKYEESLIAVSKADPAGVRRFNDLALMGTPMKDVFRILMSEAPKVGNEPPAFQQIGPKSCNALASVFENMTEVVAPYAARGIIWYQGESDDGTRAPLYDESLKTLVASWRRAWGEKLPFFQVMLAPFRNWGMVDAMDYPMLRRMQKKAADTGDEIYVACIMDEGEETNIHPRHKRPAGERLALLAEKYVYGQDVVADSPAFASAVREGDAIRVNFVNTAGALTATREITGLELFADGEAVSCTAEIDGDTLLVRSDAISAAKSLELRYAEQNFVITTLYGATGLPVFPFTAVL